MTTENETKASDGSRSIDGLVRRCYTVESGWSFEVNERKGYKIYFNFHGWTKVTRCPIGDGSMAEWVTVAILEASDGTVVYEEPHNIHFVV